jgi:hypothetical protein
MHWNGAKGHVNRFPYQIPESTNGKLFVSQWKTFQMIWLEAARAKGMKANGTNASKDVSKFRGTPAHYHPAANDTWPRELADLVWIPVRGSSLWKYGFWGLEALKLF